mmetsp:Transcript_26526/g.23447  ORF Transcript_26526/g.23447 Transcript_26526/m.23447 type:complete len:148 (+) Transcript_26526:159-602(+)
MISMTRTNISNQSSSIDKMSVDTLLKKHSNLNVHSEQPYFEKQITNGVINTKFSKKFNMKNQNNSFIQQILEGFIDTKEEDYQTQNSVTISPSKGRRSKYKKRTNRGSKRISSKYITESLVPSLNKKNVKNINLVKKKRSDPLIFKQ